MIRLLAILLAMGAAACATSGAVPRPFPGATGSTGATGVTGAGSSGAASSGATAIAIPEQRFQPAALLQTAMGFRGVPYRNGGSDPSGFDCSGFVQYVFAQHGLALPREVQQQYTFGDRVDVHDAKTGDLIYFSTSGSGATHVGLVVDTDQFVHAPSSKGVVRVERFSAQYWAQRLVGVKRLR